MFKNRLKKLHDKPFLSFLPFLILYILIVIFFKKDAYVGDESRYLMFAKNILQGFYSPPPPEINLWNGPGYPLLISLFLSIKLPDIFIVLSNALWLYLSLILVYKTLKLYLPSKKAFWWTVALGSYYPVYRMLPKILTETFTWFLIALIVYQMIRVLIKPKTNLVDILMPAFSIFYLMMTKVIYAYVVLFMLIILILISIVKHQKSLKRSLMIFGLAMLMSLPYLNYTQHLTGKIFYWSNAGSLSLYTMSTPYPEEDGRFMTPLELVQSPNHAKEADSIINKMPALAMDEALKKIALKNIQNHPKKYFKNWIANWKRLFFDERWAKPFKIINLVYIFPNLIILYLILSSFVLAFRHQKKISLSLKILFLFFAIYFLGSSLLSAFSRIFYITLPFWIVWCGVVYNSVQTKTS